MKPVFEVDAVKFILEEEKEFLHRAKSFAKGLAGAGTNEREILAYSRKFALAVHNYELILSDCKEQMPTDEAKQRLETLLIHMAKAFEGRNTLKTEMIPVADDICLSYVNLVQYLSAHNPLLYT